MLSLKVVLLAVLAEAIALPNGPSCRGTQSAGTVSNVTITSGGLSRYYLISVPSTYKQGTASPLILSYHGGERTAEDQLQLDQLTNTQFNTKYIVVYPQGINACRFSLENKISQSRLTPKKDFWQGVPDDTVNDLQFTSDILDQVEKKYTIDTKRIYATGKSDGAGFNNVLACDSTMSARFAAFAPVSGAFYVVNTTACEPSTISIPCNPNRKHIPFLEFHGGNDTTIHYAGAGRKGECLPSIPHFIQQWAARDGLGLTNVTSQISSNTVSYKFGSGSEAGLVEHIYDSVIGHDWPSTAPNADNQVAGHQIASYNATPIVLEFFDKYTL